jgi:hypothetical protein
VFLMLIFLGNRVLLTFLCLEPVYGRRTVGTGKIQSGVKIE